MNKTTKLLIPLFFGVSFAYFIWLVWEKLTTMIGDSDKVLLICLLLLLLESGLVSCQLINLLENSQSER